MSEEDDNNGVKAHPPTQEMTDQDTVMILTGNWVREDDGKWVFDSLHEEAQSSPHSNLVWNTRNSLTL
ncbi:hypothetical protein F2Q69_00051999 [Brassica cretica]|uniref:Uncharacterized protein n=1 Tax=Brassica cretica TaxID=69181 RepID=A0A8S9N3U5_BRACR|nr:hypothetical protein F2Q69_00051999 [Brassica cretica]